MAVFQDRHGNWHESRAHEATFNGSHNQAKSLVLITLFQRYKARLGGLSASELHAVTGVSLTVLRSKLLVWTKWKYVQRRVAEGKRPHYSYTISERGSKFVTIRIPPDRKNDYISMLNEVRLRGRRTLAR